MSTALLSRHLAAAAVLAFAALGAASSAHARSDVSFSIGIHVPGGHVQAAPIYLPPQPVYVQPRPVYVQPRPVYVQPAPVYMQPAPVYMQPRPVFMQPQPTYIYYGERPGWQRGKWHHKRHHGNKGHFDDRGRYDDDHGGHRR